MENPADIASRGCSFAELEPNLLWQSGPSWLKEFNFPKIDGIASFDSELQNPHLLENHVVFTVVQELKSVIDAYRFSSWSKLLRVVCGLLFIDSSKKFSKKLF